MVAAILDLEMDWRPDANILMLLFDLTPSEARIAALLAVGRTTAEITLELSISENTLKTHLRRILEKTATSRQVELVSLLARVGSVG